MYEVVRSLIGKEEIPDFYEVQYQMPYQCLEDVGATLQQEIEDRGLMERICPGDRVAITAGSREISNIVKILHQLVDMVKERGAYPHIVAAMGSHGGATGQGQRAVLSGYGIDEISMGCPVVSEMEVDFVGKTENGMEVYIDRFAAGCDKIIVVGRVKAHTDFHGKVESGLAKMIAIGLGKQRGASLCHQAGFSAMSENILQISKVVRKNKPVAFGIAIVEDAFHNTALIRAVPSEAFEEEEPGLLEESKKLMPRIPYRKIDILIVDEIGKNFSGAGMDPNVTGRSPRLGISSPYAERIVVLNISEQSHNAATGIGNADVITRRAFEGFGFDVTYANGITSNDPESIKIPAVMPADREAIQFAMCVLMGERKQEVPRIVWIKNTSDLSRFYITESLLEETYAGNCLKQRSGPKQVLFDAAGYVQGMVKKAERIADDTGIFI